MGLRFNRQYKLIIRYSSTDVVEITPPLNISFEAKKTIIGDVNELKINIYNLSLSKRNRLIKDKDEKKEYLQVILQAGYDELTDVFIGNVYEAGSVKKGTDFITTLVCKDGGYDFRNSFTSKTIEPNVNVIGELISDMPNTKLGKIVGPTLPRIRDKVLVGSTVNLIQENLEDNQTYFIDNEKLNVINGDSLLDDFAVEVSAQTGLLNTPYKQESFIICETLFNPIIKIGGQVKLVSVVDNLNDLYRVDTIQYSGELRGSDWKQTLFMIKSKGFKLVS